ncbi:uncharacterized protein, partial [Paramormyrops kingsleyae]|uniref:uncharacterized protein n=1 Tax=Paramormyrops kingsleyae TaxID=1676925 RepID=UPI003B96B07A
VQTLQCARAPSTRALYSYRWEVFRSWCEQRHECPRSCPLSSVLEFLQEQFDQGKSPSTLKVFLAAISACHGRVDGKALGANPLSIQFIKGVQRLRPRRLPSVPAWQLHVVLDALLKPPFEPIADIDLKWLSQKVAFLLAITSAKRVGELHALSVHADCFHVNPDGAGVVLRPNPAFMPKVLSVRNLNQVVVLYPFHPPPFASEEDRTLHTLCPVWALLCYVDRTKGFRLTDQLFVCHGAGQRGKALSKQRLSRWVVNTIKQAYQLSGLPSPVATVAHSTRGIAASWVLLKGVPLQDICQAACWSSPLTFARFYDLNVVSPLSFGNAVLSS